MAWTKTTGTDAVGNFTKYDDGNHHRIVVYTTCSCADAPHTHIVQITTVAEGGTAQQVIASLDADLK